MKNFETVYFVDRNEWRNWLQKNFREAGEIWLVYPKKSSGKPRILYNDAVEGALCFGWIDSIIKSVDDEHTAQRFTPRKVNSTYSQPNRERLHWLTQQKMLHPSIQEISKKILQEDFVFPRDILEIIKKSSIAWSNYQKLSLPYRRIRIAYIDSARKRPEEFEKRLTNFINKTSLGKMIAGFGGIKKHY